jgi:homoserine kinase
MKFKPFQVMAPATTANLGPGYDCLGMALDIWNCLEVVPNTLNIGASNLVEVIGEGADELPTDKKNLVYRSMLFLFNEADQKMPSVLLRCHNQIPLERGLGSSAAAIAAGLVAANALCSVLFSQNELLEMAATIEGHPDNVTAAVLGGLQLIVNDEQELFTASVNLFPNLHAVLFIPEARVATGEARAVLPESVSRVDAVYNMSRIALLIAGLATNHPEYLGVGTQDRLHQQFRQHLFPGMKPIFTAARDAGALGVFLSGSGSAILAFTQGREMTVAYEMAEAARVTGVVGDVKITRPTLLGAHLVDQTFHGSN